MGTKNTKAKISSSSLDENGMTNNKTENKENLNISSIVDDDEDGDLKKLYRFSSNISDKSEVVSIV